MRQHYTEEEAHEILLKAAERQALRGEMSREQLLQIASEAGIAPDALERAEAEWESERGVQRLRAAFNAERRQEFRSDLLSYIGVNVFLLLLNRVVTPGFWWVVFPILGWGLGLFFHFIEAYTTSGSKYEEAFQKWLAHREARALQSSDLGPNPYARP